MSGATLRLKSAVLQAL